MIRRLRSALPLAAVPLLLALASCGGGSRTTTVTKSVSTPAPVFFQGTDASPAQRPDSLLLTGDGTLIVGKVQWTSWGGPVATGTGEAEYHGCTPDCAQAPQQTAVVSIRLSQIRVCSGRQYYSGLTLTQSSGQLLDESFVQRSWSPC